MNTSRHDDWALLSALDLDIVRPGFAGAFLRASHERRQVITAYLAGADAEANSAEIADFLMSADHRSILRAAFAEPGRGLRRALGKSGTRTHQRRYYRDLNTALADGPAHVRAAIMQSQVLDAGQLSLINALPPRICDIRVLDRMSDTLFVDDLLGAINMIMDSGVDQVAFVEALIRSKVEVQEVIQRWTLRLPFPEGPIPASREFRPITNGRELREAALRYRNCSRRYVIDCLAGKCAFGEYTAPDGRQVMALMEKRHGQWYLEGVYTTRNRKVAEDLRGTATAFAAERDVPTHRQTRAKNERLSALRRINRAVFDW